MVDRRLCWPSRRVEGLLVAARRQQQAMSLRSNSRGYVRPGTAAFPDQLPRLPLPGQRRAFWQVAVRMVKPELPQRSNYVMCRQWGRSGHEQKDGFLRSRSYAARYGAQNLKAETRSPCGQKSGGRRRRSSPSGPGSLLSEGAPRRVSLRQ